jgi:hypothetical protein
LEKTTERAAGAPNDRTTALPQAGLYFSKKRKQRLTDKVAVS